jgi:hypothetical protein
MNELFLSLHHEEFSGACRNSFVPDKIHIK